MTIEAREKSFASFFVTATGGLQPYRWQLQVALDGLPDVLPVPTGLGKTEIVLAWAWRRFVAGEAEPLHLVYCLPMRSLVTQTVARLQKYFKALSALDVDVPVHALMGGAIDDQWAKSPDLPWVLVGTQDQLLSRALNRGYAMSRFEWPVHFGLLNNDCRWIIDEVQLMGPGLWTTAQLDWMRRKRFSSLKTCLTTWMSATVGTSFLETVDRKRDGLCRDTERQEECLSALKSLFDVDPNLQWWRDAMRPVEWTTSQTAKAVADEATKKHQRGTLSVIICNTVGMARAVFRALTIEHKVLLTSRFRKGDRRKHEQRLFDFDAARKAGTLEYDDPGLICVSTQVIEAGVDISAHHIWSELAPWPSVLQRIGRLNRSGRDQGAQAWFWETPKEKERGRPDRIGPYEAKDIARSKKLLDAFRLLSQSKPFAQAIEELRERHLNELTEALQSKASPLPRALDVHGLFSTERDVHGGFTDVSAFVRGVDPNADLTVFWRHWSGKVPPRGDRLDGPPIDVATEGCPVSFVRLADMLKSCRSSGWLWNDESEHWERLSASDLRPGMVVMLKHDAGGYDPAEGWTGDPQSAVGEVPTAGRGEALRGDPLTEIGCWSRLDVHLADARREAGRLCDRLQFAAADPRRTAVIEGAGLHDIGKAHPQWQDALPDRSGIPGALLAKSPRLLAVDLVSGSDAVRARVRELRREALALLDQPRRRGRDEVVRLRWAVDERLRRDELSTLRSLDGVRWAGHAQFRPALRHEAASALGMWSRYRNGRADYPALAVYLAAAHHGKVRTVLRSTTGEADDVFGIRRDPDVITIGAERWALDFSVAKDGAEGQWDGDEFVLRGHGWTGLIADLLGPWRPNDGGDAGVVPADEPRHLGPFALAYLEALVRIADWRASEHPSASTKPSEVRHDD